MRWWGWGRDDRRVLLTPELARLLDRALALDGHLRVPVAFGDVALRDVSLQPRARARL